MINELFVYGRKDSIFKNICAQLDDIQDRYHVSPNYGYDLNTTNLQKFIKDPAYGLQDVSQKYPICVCITPRSTPTKINDFRWELFYFTLFFLERTGYINNNEIRDLDDDSQLSQDENPDSWSRMKMDAMSFLDLLELTLQGNVTTDEYGEIKFKRIFNVDFDKVSIRRISNFGVDKVSGVQLDFSAYLSIAQCEVIIGDITYVVNKYLPDYYSKELNSVTSVTVEEFEHKLPKVRGITMLDQYGNEVEVDDSINGTTVTVRSNINLLNHTLIIF